MRALGDQDPVRFTTVIAWHVADRVNNFCYKQRMTSSAFLRMLVDQWLEAENEKQIEEQGLGTDEQLALAVHRGVLTAYQAGLTPERVLLLLKKQGISSP